MNERALKTLEYQKIIEMLKQYAGSAAGKEKCAGLLPLTDLEQIKTMQRETGDALSHICRKGSLSFGGVPDVRAAIKLLEVGSSLLASELLKISSVLTATLRVKTYGGKLSEEQEPDCLTERFSMLEPLSALNNEIMRCILSEEEIADDASSELKSIRRAIKAANDKIKDQLNSIVNSQESKLMLQDNLITMRNGRYCLPVKQEYKGQFGGMIHDQSAKGLTVFMEPLAVVKLNNELSELFLKEQREIEKILARLSSEAAQYTEALAYNIETLTELDFIFARAALAKEMKATEPVFNQKGYINIKKGRHPLIDSHKVVPIDIYTGDAFRMLVITGPNTGGKTVTLKTVGLFTLMGQAGLHIPAFDGSELAVFDEVFADIGDEQSIEQSLSTFSSHMTNTVSILKQCDTLTTEDKQALILFDELGAGTDPTEGAALAISILTHLHVPNLRTIATTHYSELKIYALSTPGVSNACCEFDIETLRPTYRLLIGIPGKSNAFAISSKLGLAEEIIDYAKRTIGKREQSFEDVIAELDKQRIQTEQDQRQAAAYKAEIEQERKRLKEKSEKLDASKDRILREANERARDILQDAKNYADDTIRKFNKWSAGGYAKDMENERNELRNRLGNHEENLAIKKKKSKQQYDASDFKVGDSVLVLTLNQVGVICTQPNARGDMSVRMGALISQVNIRDVEPVQGAKEPGEKTAKDAGSGSVKMNKALTIHPELNLIGKRVDEALPELDKYLDDAYLAQLAKVTIIHGRGTGALKDAVHAHLKKVKYVKGYRLGEFGEGDRGVTVVEFKQS